MPCSRGKPRLPKPPTLPLLFFTLSYSIGTALFHTPIQRMQLFQDVSRCFKFHSFIRPVKSFTFRYCARPQEAPCHLSCPSCHGSPANLQASTAVGVARGITRQRWRQHEMSKKTFQYISIRMFASSCLKHGFQKSNTLHHIASHCIILHHIASYCKFARLCHEFAFLVLHPRCSSAFSTTPRQALQRGQIDRNLHSSARAKPLFCLCIFCIFLYFYILLLLSNCFSDPFWRDSWLSTTYSLTSHTCPQ